MGGVVTNTEAVTANQHFLTLVGLSVSFGVTRLYLSAHCIFFAENKPLESRGNNETQLNIYPWTAKRNSPIAQDQDQIAQNRSLILNLLSEKEIFSSQKTNLKKKTLRKARKVVKQIMG